MAAQLIGIAVLVTLKDPQHTVVQGRVANVIEQTATLVLQDVYFPATGHRLPGFTVEGSHIADISVQPVQTTVSTPTYPPSHAPPFPPQPQHIPPTAVQYGARPPTAPPVEAPTLPQTHEAPAVEPAKPKQAFVDPAILSFGKRPAVQTAEAPTTPVKPIAAAAAAKKPGNTSPFAGIAKKASISGKSGKAKEDPATLTRPFNALGLETGEDVEESDDPTINEEHMRRASISKTRTGKPLETPVKAVKKTKKGARGKKQKNEQLLPPAQDGEAPDSSPEAARKTPANYKGKGWRQTPMLQDQTATRTPGLIGGKVGMEAVRVANRKSRRQKALDATNGWATEDATDVQELPDFDFAENLSKFDKRTVFEQIRNEDTTADEDRLTQASFRISPSDTTCHTITPGTMTAVEELAEVEFGLTEDIMSENAARGIAQVALLAVNPGGRRLARENLAVNARPVVVVLAGNHRTGARAIAAARHLHARGPRVVVALLGYERPADYDKDVRRQLELLKRFGGFARSWTDVQRGLKRLEAPPELIIDALLGRNKEFDALGREDRSTAMTIVGWANKSRASVLSVEGPSGVGGSTGEVSIIEGEPLEVRAKYIVCLGAPRSGLFRALQMGYVRDSDWLIWVVDLGLNRAWKRVGGLGRKGVRFGSEWAVQIRFDAGEAETEGGEGR
ncbi:putative n domain protein [Neofusicoccum parvum UCRNP2]|uniref:Enhancer of mRNA-decapping protein 3 n=1 Tax=Botryosphaeria parva (strain UCR-NP2) TaxID=1287680 RepID=R1GLB5_BOTPV|nr:putative n domain protein [Neofusicoccum parvum UCRNP2]